MLNEQQEGRTISPYQHTAAAATPERKAHAIDHAVIISGHSGAGKSTFIDLLERRKLPIEIASLLPEGIADWPAVFQHSDLRQLPQKARALGKSDHEVVIHYDISEVWLTHSSFEKDRILNDLKQVDQITIVHIEPEVDMLIYHLKKRFVLLDTPRSIRPFFERHMLRHVDLEWAVRMIDRMAYVIQPFGAARRQRKRQRSVTLIEKYRDQEWLRQWDADWRNHVMSLTRTARFLSIRPVETATGDKTFALVSSDYAPVL